MKIKSNTTNNDLPWRFGVCQRPKRQGKSWFNFHNKCFTNLKNMFNEIRPFSARNVMTGYECEMNRTNLDYNKGLFSYNKM